VGRDNDPIALVLGNREQRKVYSLKPFDGCREMYLGPNAKVRWRILKSQKLCARSEEQKQRYFSQTDVEGPERINSRRIIGRGACAIIQ
jgi:hypothetical protein